jgi:hypothetical protein
MRDFDFTVSSLIPRVPNEEVMMGIISLSCRGSRLSVALLGIPPAGNDSLSFDISEFKQSTEDVDLISPRTLISVRTTQRSWPYRLCPPVDHAGQPQVHSRQACRVINFTYLVYGLTCDRKNYSTRTFTVFLETASHAIIPRHPCPFFILASSLEHVHKSS